jgi:uncharacterized protein
MQLHQDLGVKIYTITSYAPGAVTVAGPRAPEGQPGGDVHQTTHTLTSSFVVTPSQLLTDWPPQRVSALADAHFGAILDVAPEVLLLGSGMRLQWPPPRLLKPLMEAGIGVEVMDSGAACRTYNILAADGRRVAAAILMIEG